MTKRTAIADDGHGKCSECGRCKCCGDKTVVIHPYWPHYPYVYTWPSRAYTQTISSTTSGQYTATNILS